MKAVGIIANPQSGRDTRRLVAYGSVFSNIEKANIVKRVLLALDSMGIKDVVIMPEKRGIGLRALEGLDVGLSVAFLTMDIAGDQDDSTTAARMMKEMGVACIVTLGGDGTNRVVAKACKDIPLVPISTGTNNVFPVMVEGTIAGMAAGAVAAGCLDDDEIATRMPCLEIMDHATVKDVALVDVVVMDHVFSGSRAIYDETEVQEIFLTRAEPDTIGFSAVGGALIDQDLEAGKGLHITMGAGETSVLAPIAPGLMRRLPIKAYRTIASGKAIPLPRGPSFLALDGEREIYMSETDELSIRFNPEGPVVVDIRRTLQAARRSRMLISEKMLRGGDI